MNRNLHLSELYRIQYVTNTNRLNALSKKERRGPEADRLRMVIAEAKRNYETYKRKADGESRHLDYLVMVCIASSIAVYNHLCDCQDAHFFSDWRDQIGAARRQLSAAEGVINRYVNSEIDQSTHRTKAKKIADKESAEGYILTLGDRIDMMLPQLHAYINGLMHGVYYGAVPADSDIMRLQNVVTTHKMRGHVDDGLYGRIAEAKSVAEIQRNERAKALCQLAYLNDALGYVCCEYRHMVVKLGYEILNPIVEQCERGYKYTCRLLDDIDSDLRSKAAEAFSKDIEAYHAWIGSVMQITMQYTDDVWQTIDSADNNFMNYINSKYEN